MANDAGTNGPPGAPEVFKRRPMDDTPTALAWGAANDIAAHYNLGDDTDYLARAIQRALNECAAEIYFPHQPAEGQG